MVALGGLASAAEGYEDVQKQQYQQMLEMMRMRQQMAANQPMGPGESPFRDTSGPGIGGPGQGPAGNFGGGAPGQGPMDMTGIRPTIAGYPTQQVLGALGAGEAKSYTELGPETRHGRALGLYQVMPENLREWSRQYLGREVSPEEFLASPHLQDQLAAARFGGYADKGGLPYAAGSWLGWGPKGDVFGTTAGPYSQGFMRRLGQPQGGGQPPGPQVAMAGGGLPSGAVPGGGQPPSPQNQPTGLSGLLGQAGQAAGAQGQGPGRLARDLPGEVASVQQPAAAAAAPSAGAPGGMMPRASGMLSPGEYARKLLSNPAMTSARFSKLMDDYNKIWGPEQREQAHADQIKILEERLAQQKEQQEATRKEKEKLQASEDVAKTQRAAVAEKGRVERQQERQKATAELVDKREQARREDARQAQDFKRDEAERNEQRRRERMQIQVELKAEPTMKEEGIDSTAKMALDGNFDGAMKAAGPGQAGAANRSAIVARMFEIGKERNMSPEDINNAILGFHGRQEGVKSIARNEAKITAAASQVDAAINIVEQAQNDSVVAGLLPTTRFKSINAFLDAVREHAGDPRLEAYGAALNDAKTAVARLYSGGNAVTVSGREEADKLFNRAMNPESVKAVLEIARQTSKSDVAAIKAGRESYTKKLTEPSLADEAAKQADDPAQAALNHAIAGGASNSVMRDALIASGKTNDEAVAMIKTAQKAKEFAEKQQKVGAKEKMSSADLADVITKAAAQPTARQVLTDPGTGASTIGKGIGRMFTPPGEFWQQLHNFGRTQHLQGGGGQQGPGYGGIVP